MPKPRMRESTIDTDFFTGVSPMWQPPNAEAIPINFREPVDALADWIGPAWHDQPSSGFFRLRNYLILRVQQWQRYDWVSARHNYDLGRAWRLSRARVQKATITLLKELAVGNDPATNRLFADIIRNAFSTRAAPATKMWQNDQAIDDALNAFGKIVSATRPKNGRFGPLELDRFPSLPAPIVAVAILLADRVTCLRKDTQDEIRGTSDARRSLWSGLPPRTSAKLPWKAIGLFAAQAIPDPAGDDFDFEGLQSRTVRFAKNVVRLHLAPIA